MGIYENSTDALIHSQRMLNNQLMHEADMRRMRDRFAGERRLREQESADREHRQAQGRVMLANEERNEFERRANAAESELSRCRAAFAQERTAHAENRALLDQWVEFCDAYVILVLRHTVVDGVAWNELTPERRNELLTGARAEGLANAEAATKKAE